MEIAQTKVSVMFQLELALVIQDFEEIGANMIWQIQNNAVNVRILMIVLAVVILGQVKAIAGGPPRLRIYAGFL